MTAGDHEADAMPTITDELLAAVERLALRKAITGDPWGAASVIVQHEATIADLQARLEHLEGKHRRLFCDVVPLGCTVEQIERRLQEAEQRRHQSHDALTMRIEWLERMVERQEAALFEKERAALEGQATRNPNLDEAPYPPINMYHERERVRAAAPPFRGLGYIADHFNEPDPERAPSEGRRLGWVVVSDAMLDDANRWARLQGDATILRRVRRDGSRYFLMERDEFAPFEGEESAAPIYYPVETYFTVEWQRA